jgi:hypothetical protein
MYNSVWAVVHSGRIEPVEPVELPEGSRGRQRPFGNSARESWGL